VSLAQIVLLSADGLGTNEIVRRTAKSKTGVWRWQERFAEKGCDGLLRDKTRRSRIPALGAEVAVRGVALTQGNPPGETTHWAAVMMAKLSDIGVSSVQRIWRAHGLQPHRVRWFKLRTGPKFAAKLCDVFGLYVDPLAHAIGAEIPAGKFVHVAVGNFAAHKHRKVRALLDGHERFTFHFVPSSWPWLNAVEGFFAKLAKRRLKRGVFRSIVDLQASINRFHDETTQSPSCGPPIRTNHRRSQARAPSVGFHPQARVCRLSGNHAACRIGNYSDPAGLAYLSSCLRVFGSQDEHGTTSWRAR
jgi:transposase